MFEVYPVNPELGRVSTYSVATKISFLRSHFRKIEDLFDSESKGLTEESRLESERTKDYEDDCQVDYRASDALREIEFIYLRMHRYSAVLASYSYLETSLNKICSDLQQTNNILLSVTDLHGDGINRCKFYLERLAGIDFSSINEKWSGLTTLNKIRNCIMHADGDAERVRGRDKFIRLVETSGDLSFIEKKLVMVTREFVEKSINDIEETLLYLIGRNNR